MGCAVHCCSCFMRNLAQNKAQRSQFLYIGMGMIVAAFITFMLLSRGAVDYLIVDTLMLGACGIFDLFWEHHRRNTGSIPNPPPPKMVWHRSFCQRGRRTLRRCAGSHDNLHTTSRSGGSRDCTNGSMHYTRYSAAVEQAAHPAAKKPRLPLCLCKHD